MKKITIVLSIAVLVLGVTVTLITVNTNSQTKDSPLKKSDDYDIPVVDISSPVFRTNEDKKIRQGRGEKYNTGHPLEDIFRERQAALYDLPLSHESAKPAFPVSQSEAILIGTVTDSQAFLSTDKSYVYCEFSVHVEDVLKNFSPAPLAPNVNTTIERAGGIVRFASGKTLQLGYGGERLPQKQKRYLFFLKWSDSGKDFMTMTGYELSGGKIVPLDGATDLSIYKNYRKYSNEEESRFLQIVKGFIDNPIQEVPNK